MTREEAKEVIEDIIIDVRRTTAEEDKALRMAIEALKAERNTLDRSDLIRLGDVKKAICEVCLDGESLYKGCKHHWNCPYLTKIGKIPTVSTDRPRGEWVEPQLIYTDAHKVTCTNCGGRVVIVGETNFCPNCGADMKGDTE